jgi:glycine oxidase
MAAGHYRNGLCLAPVTAEIMAAYLAGKEPPIDANPWKPRKNQ